MIDSGGRDGFSLLTAALTAAVLALALGTLTGPAVVTTAGTELDRSSTGAVAASMPKDAVQRLEAVGVEPHRTLTVGRAVDVAGPRAVVPGVVGLAAGAACVGLRRRPGRRAGDGVLPCVPPPRVGPGRRCAPPLVPAR